MNNLPKKMLVFLLVMAAVAALGWFGRKAYKNATENRALTEAGRYLEKKDERNAVLCLQRALQINPLSFQASKLMADMLESAGAPAALGWRIRVSQLRPNDMTNRLLWAQTAIKLHDAKSATDALSGLDGKAKAGALCQKLSGALAWSLGRNAEAAKYYREALRLEPGNLATVINLDILDMSSTNADAAKAARLSLLRVATNSSYRMIALRYLATDATAKKSYSDALRYSAQIVRDATATTGDKIEYLQSLQLSKDANFGSWLDSMKQSANSSPDEAFALGKWMAMTQTPEKALDWLESLPPAVRTNQPVPLIIADCDIGLKNWQGLLDLVDKEDWAEANCLRLALTCLAQRSLQKESASQSSWHRAMRQSAHRLDRLTRLAQVTANWGWDAENTAVLKELISDFPREKWAVDELVNKLYASGNTRELADLVAKVYSVDSSNPRAKNNLANISLLRKADLDEAYRLAREAYDSSPENPFFASTYAYSLLMQKKEDEALKIVTSVKPEFLQIPSVAAYYGVVEAQSGNKNLAKAPLERAAAARLLPEEKEMVRLALARL